MVPVGAIPDMAGGVTRAMVGVVIPDMAGADIPVMVTAAIPDMAGADIPAMVTAAIPDMAGGVTRAMVGVGMLPMVMLLRHQPHRQLQRRNKRITANKGTAHPQGCAEP